MLKAVRLQEAAVSEQLPGVSVIFQAKPPHSRFDVVVSSLVLCTDVTFHIIMFALFLSGALIGVCYILWLRSISRPAPGGGGMAPFMPGGGHAFNGSGGSMMMPPPSFR